MAMTLWLRHFVEHFAGGGRVKPPFTCGAAVAVSEVGRVVDVVSVVADGGEADANAGGGEAGADMSIGRAVAVRRLSMETRSSAMLAASHVLISSCTLLAARLSWTICWSSRRQESHRKEEEFKQKSAEDRSKTTAAAGTGVRRPATAAAAASCIYRARLSNFQFGSQPLSNSSSSSTASSGRAARGEIYNQRQAPPWHLKRTFLLLRGLSNNHTMASFSGPLYWPLSAMAVAAFAAATSMELPDRLTHHKLADAGVTADTVVLLPASQPDASGTPTTSSLSGMQFWPGNNVQIFHLAKAPVASLPVLQTIYQYAKLAEASGQEPATAAVSGGASTKRHWVHSLTHSATGCSVPFLLLGCSVPVASARPQVCGDSLDKSQTVVVLLGWLGSRQKHLKRYADWYTSRGYHAVTFTLPMSDIVSYDAGGKSEKNVEMLSEHLAGWVQEENGKKIVFHTFSNTGWLCYGVILENMQRHDSSAVEKIKGCVVDSAPVAVPDSQVWALGFSAAIMKKHSVATKGAGLDNSRPDVLVVESNRDPKPAATEAVLSALEKLFDVVLNHSTINRRLSDVMELLSSKQPKCPQLYIYSSADRVIPAKSVESFVERQRRAGLEVRACDFVSSPHVDHYRSNPGLYSSQLTNFLEECVMTRCKESPSS